MLINLLIFFFLQLRYVPKWKKQACEAPATQHPGSHYVCDEAGEVKCLPGNKDECNLRKITRTEKRKK